MTSSLSPAGVLTVRAPVDPTLSPCDTFHIEPPSYNSALSCDEFDNAYYVTREPSTERYVTQYERASHAPSFSARYGDIVTNGNDFSSRAEHLKRSSLPSRRHSTNTHSLATPATTTLRRYHHEYHDPGPIFPNSRGEILRGKSPKGHIHHNPVTPADITIPHHAPLGLTSSRYGSSLSPGFTTSSVTLGAPAERLRSKSVSSDTWRPRTSSSTSLKPRVTIIREYETQPSDDVISDTATSPTTQTSIFEEFSTSRDESPRDRFDSTSSGERIITPTKYKTAKQRRAMSLSCSDSESSSLAASPPAFGGSFQREITPRQLFTPPALVVSGTNGFNSDEVAELDTGHAQLKPNHPNIIATKEGRRLRMLVEVGENFRAEDIVLHLRFKKVQIRATQERSVDGRSCRSEFSKELELPAPLEPSTVRAALNGQGRLYIGGSLMANSNHQRVAALVLNDMPARGRACNVKY